MISNRLRIESAIEKVRKSLRHRKNSRDLVNNKLAEAAAAQQHSDPGSGDELIFLTRRRVSLPNGPSVHDLDGRQFFKEQNRRLKFMAQFEDNASKNTNDSAYSDTDSSVTPPPSSPEF
jgi:hypothetical protein